MIHDREGYAGRGGCRGQGEGEGITTLQAASSCHRRIFAHISFSETPKTFSGQA
jgi:hypothetical protein